MKYINLLNDYINRYLGIIIVCLTLMIAGLTIYTVMSATSYTYTTPLKQSLPRKLVGTTPKQIYVDIKGMVQNPGVFKIEQSARVIDVVNLAGGLLKEADTSYNNLSKKIIDEMVIVIYSKDQIKDLITKQGSPIPVESTCTCPSITNDSCIKNDADSEALNNLVNINTADAIALGSLPGIGPTKAADIIKYRSTKPFSVIDDLKNVSGIGDATFAKIKDLITI